MKTHNFTVIASGLDASDFADRFFEAGCDDATISLQKGLFVLEFDRESPTFSRALLSALLDVHSAGAKIERIEPDYLVSASEISRRSGCTRAAVSMYAKELRGNSFPRPVARITTDSPLYDWCEVSDWLHRAGSLSLEAVVEAKVVREVNKVAVEHAAPSVQLGKRVEQMEKHLDLTAA